MMLADESMLAVEDIHMGSGSLSDKLSTEPGNARADTEAQIANIVKREMFFMLMAVD